jgi:hypothetical protein
MCGLAGRRQAPGVVFAPLVSVDPNQIVASESRALARVRSA